MTIEERLDRLERIARMMVRPGLRARRQMRDQDEKINIMIESQMKNEGRFAKLAESKAHTDRRLDALSTLSGKDTTQRRSELDSL